jgi:hypothetical protein
MSVPHAIALGVRGATGESPACRFGVRHDHIDDELGSETRSALDWPSVET